MRISFVIKLIREGSKSEIRGDIYISQKNYDDAKKS